MQHERSNSGAIAIQGASVEVNDVDGPDVDPAGAGGSQSREQVEQRGLPRSRRPEEPHELTGSNIQIDAGQRGDILPQ